MNQEKGMETKKGVSQMKRCGWVNDDPLYINYHDTEWGVPVYDDRLLFEMLTLEGAQAGLSWYTVLKKREHYKKVFDDFDVQKIVQYDEKKIHTLLADKGIIRHQLKIRSVVKNAKAFINIQQTHGSFANYIWSFVDGKPIRNHHKTLSDVPASTTLSNEISKDLKKKGFSFVGSTIIYAYMQAIGMIQDHVTDCFCYKEV